MKSESAVKRTPGPWSPNWEDADCNCLVILGLGRPVAQVIHDDALNGDLDETDSANARLIAAAPAMLEALEKAHYEFVGLAAYLATCAPGTIIENLETTVGNLHKKADEFELVIKKAKGE